MSKGARTTSVPKSAVKSDTGALSSPKSADHIIKSKIQKLQGKNAGLAPKYKEVCKKAVKSGIDMKASLDVFQKTDARAFARVILDLTHLQVIQLWSNNVAPHDLTDKG